MNTKKKYKTPLVDLVKLEDSDVITTSNPTITGEYDATNDKDSDSWENLGNLFK